MVDSSNCPENKGDVNELSVLLPGGARKSKLCPFGDLIPYPLNADDSIETVWQMLERGCRLFGNNRCFGQKNSKSSYNWITYNEFMDRARDFGSGLVNIGMSPGQSTCVGIYGKNCVEWVVAEFGCFSQSVAIIPLFDTLGPEAAVEMIQIGEIKIIVCDDEKKALKILLKSAEIPTLKHIIVMNGICDELKQQGIGKEIKLHSFKEIEALGNQKRVPILPPRGSDIYMVCFTSGTTGDPKGAVLTNKYYVTAINALWLTLESENIFLTETDVTISYLPLAHIFEHLVQLIMIMVGGSIGFYGGDINLITDDFKVLQPTFLPAVPRLLNKLYDKAQVLFHSKSKPDHNVILNMKSMDLERNTKTSPAQLDPSLYKPFHHILGGKIRVLISGAAPISETVLNFYRLSLGYQVVEAYGQTECGPVTLNVMKENTIGSVGPPIPSCILKLMDVPEMGYFAKNNEGEVCVKGHSVFKGYLKNPQKTAEVIDSNGWLHTGDIGVFLPNGTLKIVDRMKNIFKLSLGEFIAPEKIEGIYSRSPYVSQVLVCGDSSKDYIVCIVIPEKETIWSWIKEHIKCETWNEACKSPVLQQIVLNDMWKLGKEAQLSSFEQTKAVYLHPELLTLETGLLTPTLKTRRAMCGKFFKEEINAMYKAVDAMKIK